MGVRHRESDSGVSLRKAVALHLIHVDGSPVTFTGKVVLSS